MINTTKLREILSTEGNTEFRTLVYNAANVYIQTGHDNLLHEGRLEIIDFLKALDIIQNLVKQS